MARAARDARLDTRTARLKLQPAKEPYWRVLEPGRALGYRRLADGKPGTWTARLGRHDGTGRHVYQFQALGAADDLADADADAGVLTFAQAQTAARDWFTVGDKPAAPITVAEAIADYLADYTARSGKGLAALNYAINAHILPALGKLLVTDLTTARLLKFRNALATAPARRRRPAPGKLTRTDNAKAAARAAAARAARGEVDPSERLRQRQASANRVYAVLKAALNLAFRSERVDSDLAWRRVPPFRGASVPRIRYLNDDEAVRLVNACPPDFRRLVVASLLTGADYGELRHAKARDLDVAARVAGVGAKRGWHQVVLTDEAVRHFASAAAGKTDDASLFLRADGEPWGDKHQQRPMADACERAGIEPINFHILRHTYATRAPRLGASMQYVSAQLGHKDIRTTQRYYAHLVPSDMAAAIRAIPPLGVGEVSNVTALRLG